jgi:hypothetical protein
MRTRFALGFAIGSLLLLAGLWVGSSLDLWGAREDPQRGAQGLGAEPDLGSDDVGGASGAARPARGATGGAGRSSGAGPGRRGGGGAASSDAGPVFALQFVDALNESPVPGVRVFDLENEQELAAADGSGFLRLALPHPERVALFGAGLLARVLSEAERKALREDPQQTLRLPVYVDRYTKPLRIVFDWSGAERGRGLLQFLIRRIDDEKEHVRDFPRILEGAGRSIDPSLQRAWEAHIWLAGRVPLNELYYSLRPLPFADEGRDQLGGGSEHQAVVMRFSQSGDYEIRAWVQPPKSEGPLWPIVGETRFAMSAGRSELRVPMSAVRGLRVRVLDGKREPISGAKLTSQSKLDRRLPVLRAESDEAGYATFNSLFGEGQRVSVIVDGFEVAERELAAREQAHEIIMKALPRVRHTLSILERGSGKVLEGARLILGEPSQPIADVVSNAQGRATIELVSGQARTLEVRCDGYLTWREMLQAGMGPLPARIELIPTTDDRLLAARLVTIVWGTIRDQQGKPVVGARVQLGTPGGGLGAPLVAKAKSPRSPEFVGRVILAGRQYTPRLMALTDNQGRYRLYSAQGGAAELQVFAPQAQTIKRPVTLVPGKALELDLTVR